MGMIPAIWFLFFNTLSSHKRHLIPWQVSLHKSHSWEIFDKRFLKALVNNACTTCRNPECGTFARVVWRFYKVCKVALHMLWTQQSPHRHGEKKRGADIDFPDKVDSRCFCFNKSWNNVRSLSVGSDWTMWQAACKYYNLHAELSPHGNVFQRLSVSSSTLYMAIVFAVHTIVLTEVFLGSNKDSANNRHANTHLWIQTKKLIPSILIPYDFC